MADLRCSPSSPVRSSGTRFPDARAPHTPTGEAGSPMSLRRQQRGGLAPTALAHRVGRPPEILGGLRGASSTDSFGALSGGGRGGYVAVASPVLSQLTASPVSPARRRSGFATAPPRSAFHGQGQGGGGGPLLSPPLSPALIAPASPFRGGDPQLLADLHPSQQSPTVMSGAAAGAAVHVASPLGSAASSHPRATPTPDYEIDLRYIHLRDFLRGFYARHNPEMLRCVDRVSQQYYGDEVALYHKMLARYPEQHADIEWMATTF